MKSITKWQQSADNQSLPSISVAYPIQNEEPQNIYSQEEMNLYCIIKVATEISLFSLQIIKT